MAKKPDDSVPAEALAAYEKLVASAGVERKGATVPYTSMNGNMYSYLTKRGTLALRLPADAREAFMAKYDTGLVEAYGIVQKEYVEVPAALLGKTGEMKKHFAASLEYARGLKPKATTRKKTAAKKTAAKKTAAKKKR